MQSENKLLDHLLEIYGLQHSNDRRSINNTAINPNYATTPTLGQRSGYNYPNAAPIVKAARPLTSWQYDFTKRIMNKNDTYAAIPPAAGKTSPILQAFHSMFVSALGINAPLLRAKPIDFKSPDFPRLIYFGRTKQLSIESFVQNFRGDEKYGMIITVLMNAVALRLNVNMPPINPGPNQYRNGGQDARNINNYEANAKFFLDQLQNHAITTDDYNKIIRFIQDEMIAIKMGGFSPDLKSSIFGIKPIIISTPDTSGSSPVLALLKSKPEYFSAIIIDEMQEYVPRPGATSSTEDDDKFFKMLIDVVSYSDKPKKCGVHLLTGTTNMASGEQIMREFNTRYSRNFELPNSMSWSNSFSDINKPNALGSSDYAGNRSKLTLKAYSKMVSIPDKINLIRRIVVNKEKNSIVVIFGVNPHSQGGILKLLPMVIDGLLPLEHQVNGVNVANPDKLFTKDGVTNYKDAVSMNSIDGDTEILRSISPYLYGSDNAKSAMYPKKFAEMNNIEFLKYFDINLVNVTTSKTNGKYDQNADDARIRYSQEPNENNILYQGVLRGVGILFGAMDNRHKETIVALFRAGKIYCLLATNALGVGANVMCKHIYLTSLNAPPTFESIDKSSLLQLIHRAGRNMKDIPYASVYVHPDDYDWVNRALSTDPALAVEPLSPELISKAFKDNSQFIDKIKSLFS